MSENVELDLAVGFIEETHRNIFLTGKAGTGKTTLLRNLKINSKKRIVVVAPTGVAAINAGGVTIHSFFQLPFGPILPHSLTQSDNSQRRFNRNKIDIIKSLDLVIIDEISMVRADVLDGIDEVLRRYRNKNKPFGGVQLLMIGDLQQLSPVIKPAEWDLLKEYYQTAYFFCSLAFQKAAVLSIELKHIYRQTNEKFIKILNEVRHDKLSEESSKLLNERYIPDFIPNEDDGYITLTTHNHKADRINQEKLQSLKTEEKVYKATVSGEFNERNYPTEEKLLLKIGTQVMFVKNDSSPQKRYFNGKIGKVVELTSKAVMVQCDEDDFIETTTETWENIKYSIDKDTQEIKEKLEGAYTQIPLRLAWAITIHKSQGLTFDKTVIDAENSFAHGQTYVALSRCKTLEGIVLRTPIKTESIVNDRTVESFNQSITENAPSRTMLQEARKDFLLQLIEELFDYYPLNYPLRRLKESYYSNKNSLNGNIIAPLETMLDKGVIPLVQIATQFKKQLQKMGAGVDSLVDDKAIQERIRKAIVYFKKQTEEYICIPLKDLSFSTENKIIQKDFERNIQIIEDEIAKKMLCFEELPADFTTIAYLKIRAKAVLQPPKKKTKKREKIDAETKHVILFEDLRAFRNETSHIENIPPFQVFTQRTLYELCNKLPATAKQLKDVHGMGKVRIKKYGDDILDIITAYCETNNITLREDKPILKLEKKSTKEISLDFYKEGLSVAQISEKRELVESTILGHLTHYVIEGELPISDFITNEKMTKAEEIIKNTDFENLSDLKQTMGDAYSYSELRMILGCMADKQK